MADGESKMTCLDLDCDCFDMDEGNIEACINHAPERGMCPFLRDAMVRATEEAHKWLAENR